MADLIDRDALMKKICGNECGSVCDEDCENAWCNFYDYIMEAPAVNRWIPCSEQMMPDGERVLVCLTNDEVFVMTRSKDVISDGLRHLTDLSAVVRWMPIPDTYEPPESEVRDDDAIRD